MKIYQDVKVRFCPPAFLETLLVISKAWGKIFIDGGFLLDTFVVNIMPRSKHSFWIWYISCFRFAVFKLMCILSSFRDFYHKHKVFVVRLCGQMSAFLSDNSSLGAGQYGGFYNQILLVMSCLYRSCRAVMPDHFTANMKPPFLTSSNQPGPKIRLSSRLGRTGYIYIVKVVGFGKGGK